MMTSQRTVRIGTRGSPLALAQANMFAALIKPVVTSNQATWWACAQRAGIGPRSWGGRLLREGLARAGGPNDPAGPDPAPTAWSTPP